MEKRGVWWCKIEETKRKEKERWAWSGSLTGLVGLGVFLQLGDELVEFLLALVAGLEGAFLEVGVVFL